MAGQKNLLLVADRADCADLRYAAGLSVHHPAVYLRVNGRAYALVNEADLPEKDTAPRGCRVLPLSRFQPRGAPPGPGALADAIERLTRKEHARSLVVPERFPLGLARELRERKLRLKPRAGDLFFPERAFKSPEEVTQIRAAILMAEVGLAEGLQALKAAQITPRGRLLYRGAPLTAERLQAIIQVAVYQAGAEPVETLVKAPGRANCSGPGRGPLRAHRPVLLRVALRSRKTGYHAVVGRTVIRGRAPEWARRFHATLVRCLTTTLPTLRPAASSPETAISLTRKLAVPASDARRRRGTWYVSGHGVGLDLREPPVFTGDSPVELRAGHLLALQLALQGGTTGSVGLEDMVLITRMGARVLTSFEYQLEL